MNKMIKKLTSEKALQIKSQIDGIFNNLSEDQIMTILAAITMNYIRKKTFNQKNSNLEEAKYFYDTMIKAFDMK